MTLIKKKITLFGLIIGGIVLLFFLFLGLNDSKKFSFSYDNASNILSESEVLKSEDSPINILFLGISGEGSLGAFLTDTIFVTSIIPSKKQITMISLPRDLWVEIPNGSTEMKINSLYQLENRGKSFSKADSYNLIKEKVEDITGLPIDHALILDLKGVEKLIDSLGGIDIWLKADMVDPNLVNPHNPSEIFHLSAGWRHLDGALIIKFIRTRYAPNGDFYRIEHQQQIIAALKDKLTKLADVWNLISWLKIWQSLSGHFITDLDFNTIWQMFPVVKNISSGQIQYLSITNRSPDELLMTSTTYDSWSKKDIYILIPKKGFENYEEINNYIKEKIYE
ncbi:MAG TPA: LCP family protein [Candidatus Paceibacterota bacterium]|nr:LCP family protein [Candidatus Paceibacterota bacterium]